MLSEAERQAILDAEIMRLVGHGYRVVARMSTTAQLIRPKTFSVLAAVLWLLVFVVGLIIYLLIYAAASDESIYLEVAEDGFITGTGSGLRQLSATDWVCDACGRANHQRRAICKRCRSERAV